MASAFPGLNIDRVQLGVLLVALLMFANLRGIRQSARVFAVPTFGFITVLTGIVLVVIGITKGPEGAWIVMIIIPVLVGLFKVTKSHYDQVAAQLTLRDWTPPSRRTNAVLVPISGVQRAVVGALRYAESISTDVRAIYVHENTEAIAALRKEWNTWGESTTLVVLDSPSVIEPLLEYIEDIERERTNAYITVPAP